MTEESRRQADRQDVVKKIREAWNILRRAEDINEQWGFIEEETFKKSNDAIGRMLIEVNRGEDVVL